MKRMTCLAALLATCGIAAAGGGWGAAGAAMDGYYQGYTGQTQQPAQQQQGEVAFWNGESTPVHTVTNQIGYRCGYNYAGRIFYRVYLEECPLKVSVN